MRKTSSKKQIAFLTFFLINIFTLYSQNSNILNVNVIISDSTEKALKDVAIYNSQQKIIGLTNDFGTTTISVCYGDVIVLSHISYEQKRLKISEENVVKDEDGKNYMFAVLREKATLLPEAQVIENAPHLAYKNKEVWIVDYVVGDEGITAITTTGRKSFLLHLCFEQDTLSIKQIDKKFEGLFRDVFGNIHLLGPDSTYQIYSDKGNMQLLYGITLEKHNSTFKPIAALTDSILVTKQSYYYGQEFAFFSVNRNNKKTELLCDIYGESREMAKNLNRDNVRLRRMQSQDTLFFYNPILKSDETEEFENQFLYFIMLKDIYVPSYNIDDNIYIFDFQKDAIYKYDKIGNFRDRIDITFHRAFRNTINKSWDEKIIFDKTTKKCYAQFSKDGIVTLKEIDFRDGTIKKAIELTNHVYPENIQIHDGFVYYKFIDVRQISGSDCRSLYKMKLE